METKDRPTGPDTSNYLHERLAALFAEAEAIRVWDSEYLESWKHHENDQVAFEARSRRLREIRAELCVLAEALRSKNRFSDARDPIDV